MKNIFKTLACLSVSLLAFSCTLDKIDSQMTDEEAIANIRLECDALEAYTIQSQKPQAVSFNVTSTTPWKITGFENLEWLTVSPASSSESSLSEDVRVTAIANNGLDDREAVLTVSGNNTDIKYKIKISQLRKGQLTVTPIDHDFATAGEAQQLTVEANLDWEASSDQDWLTLDVTSGTSDGPLQSTTVKATAAKNESVVRTATLTFIAGDDKIELIARQKGQSLEFIDVTETALPSEGGDLLLNVNATLAWTVESDSPEVVATKVGDDKVKVTAKWNKYFTERAYSVTIRPVSEEFGDVYSTVDLTQGTNFEFEGDCVVDSQGYVTVTEGAVSRIKLKNGMRYGKLRLEVEDANFEDKCQMWYVNKVKGEGVDAQLYNWITFDSGSEDKTRLRAEGNVGGHGLSTEENNYMSKSYDIDADELCGMSSYEMNLYPDETDPTHLHMEFWFNDELWCEAQCMNPFYGNDLVGETYVGVNKEGTTDANYFVAKSCDLIVYNE